MERSTSLQVTSGDGDGAGGSHLYTCERTDDLPAVGRRLWFLHKFFHSSFVLRLLFCKGDEVDGKDGVTQDCEEDDEDPENRYVGDKLELQKF